MFESNESKIFNPKQSAKYIIFSFIFSFVLSICYYFDFFEFDLRYPWYDTCNYADLARGINETSIESIKSTFFLFSSDYSIDLYHYFDLWITIIIHKITSHNFLTSITLVTYPLLMSIFFTGVLQILGSFYYNKYTYLLLFLVPFMINIPFLNHISFLNN